MSSAIIYVFSGTDNTHHAAGMIKEALEQSGVKTVVHRVREPFEGAPSPDGFDYAGFGYPVHAFNCPEIFLRFARSLPATAGGKAFIFKTSGEPFWPNGASSRVLIKILTGKGFDVALEQHLLMPYNIVFRYDDRLVKQMLRYDRALCCLLVKRLLAGERDVIRFGLKHKIVSFLFRIQQPGAKLNGRLYRTDKKKCDLCMKCVGGCPTGNITFDGIKLRFDFKCAMCMRCAMFCLNDAVNPGLLRFWKVNGAYDFKRIKNDETRSGDFVDQNTKGYFGLFWSYYKKAGAELKRHGIEISDY